MGGFGTGFWHSLFTASRVRFSSAARHTFWDERLMEYVGTDSILLPNSSRILS